MSIFQNYPDGQLADEFGVVTGEIKALEARKDAIKAEFLGRGLDGVEGEYDAVRKVQAPWWSLDARGYVVVDDGDREPDGPEVRRPFREACRLPGKRLGGVTVDQYNATKDWDELRAVTLWLRALKR